MEGWQFAAFAVICALLCGLLRQQSEGQALLLALAAGAALLVGALTIISPVLAFIERLAELSGLNSAVFAPVLKTAGIGLLTQFSAAFCKDAGQQALGKAAEVGGTILAVYTLLPLAGAVVELLQGMAL